MKRGWLFLACAIFLLRPAAAISEESIQLRFGFPSPATSYVLTEVLKPWAENIEQMASVKIAFFPDGVLASFANAYDRTISGAADITMGVFGELPGQFPKTDVISLPFESTNSYEASVALWRLYAKGLISDEYSKVHPLALFTFPGAEFHARKRIATLEEVKGLRISVASRTIAEIARQLGAAPVSLPASDVYEGVSRGVVDGLLNSWAGVDTFKFYEVASYHVDAPLSGSHAFIFMNKESYARLPDTAKAAFDALSGEPLTKQLSLANDTHDVNSKEKIAEMHGQTVVTLSPSEEKRWKTRVEPDVEEWVARTPNGATILKAFRAEIANLRGSR